MKFFKYHFPFLFWLIVIFIESSIPSTEYPRIEIWSADKLLHMGVFGLLTLLCYISLLHQERFPFFVKHALLLSLIIASIYGASDEFHQYFIPNRDCEFWDWLSDFGGTVIAVMFIKYYLSRKFNIFKSKWIPPS